MKPRAKMPDVTVSGPTFNTAKERDKWVKQEKSIKYSYARKKV